MMELTPAQRRALRARAHSLHPVVSIAQHGLSEAVLAEIDRSLKAHELIKLRVYGAEREERESLLAEICVRLEAAPVQHIGNILIVYREKAEEAAAAPGPTRKRPAGVPPKAPARPAAPRRRLRK